MENDRRIQWQPMIEMLIVLVTILGSTIPLYMHTDTKIDAMHEAMEYRFSITDVLSSKVVIGRWPYAHGPILRHVIVCAPPKLGRGDLGDRLEWTPWGQWAVREFRGLIEITTTPTSSDVASRSSQVLGAPSVHP